MRQTSRERARARSDGVAKPPVSHQRSRRRFCASPHQHPPHIPRLFQIFGKNGRNRIIPCIMHIAFVPGFE